MRYVIRVWDRKTGKTANKTITSDLPPQAILESLKLGDKPLCSQKPYNIPEGLKMSVTLYNPATGEVIRKETK